MLRPNAVRLTGMGSSVLALVAFAGGCGIFGGSNSNAVTSRPTEFVVWGDPASDVRLEFVLLGRNDANSTTNHAEMAVATDGQVVFENGDVCNNCRVEISTAELVIEDELRGVIRWIAVAGSDIVLGTSDDGRAPFVVGTDDRILEAVASDSGVGFHPTGVSFDDDASDDTAFQDGVFTQPTGNACGNGGLLGGLLGSAMLLLTCGPMRRRLERTQ